MLHPLPQKAVTQRSQPLTPIRFGLRDPFSVLIHRNQVWSRLFIELTGYDPWVVGFARNKFERVEKLLDVGPWITFGVFGPLLISKLANHQFLKHLKKQFPITHSGNPLHVPLEWLDKVGLHARFWKASPQTLKAFGLERLSHMSATQFNKLANKLAFWKVFIIGVDLLFMAALNHTAFELRNKITERWSRKKGFSGEFNYASQDYLNQKSAAFQKSEHRRKMASIAINLIGAFSLPLILRGLLRSPRTQGPVALFKSFLPAFNYEKAMFMSKWVLLWGTVFNYNMAAVLFARDTHEVRENLTKMGTLDFFYFIGDDLIARFLAQRAQRKLAQKGFSAVNLLEDLKLGRWRFKVAKPLHEVYKEVGFNRQHPAFKQTVRNSWISLALTALCLGISTPLLNNWYTKQKVLREQRELDTAKKPVNLEQTKPFVPPMVYFYPSNPIIPNTIYWRTPVPLFIAPAYWPPYPGYGVQN